MADNLLEILLDTIPYSIWFRTIDGKFEFANKFYCDELKKNKSEVLGKSLQDLYSKELAEEFEGNYDMVLKEGRAKLFSGYQEDKFLECYIAPIKKDNIVIGFMGTLQDKTKLENSKNEIIKQKNLLNTMIDTIPDSIFYKDINGNYLDCNIAFAKDYFDKDKDEVLGKKDLEIVEDKKLLNSIIKTDNKVINSKKKESTKVIINNKDNKKYMESIKTPLIDVNGDVWGIVGISRDITDRIIAERDLKKLSYIDKLTGVYNRTYFDKKIEVIDKEKFFPLSLIMGDVDGLKLVNDSLGHLKGDELLVKISNVLKKVCKDNNLIVRWGGDEFIILLPNTTEEEAIKLCNDIEKACIKEKYKDIPLRISLGCATKTNENQNIDDLLNLAEDKLYKQKLPAKKIGKDNLLYYFKDSLEKKSKDTQAHTDRVVKYADRMSKRLNLDKESHERLILASSLHDIGKIGIPDNILEKPGKLTEIEYQVIKTHTEKGYRIAKSNHEISHIAKCILSHHERWDGLGYPLGLKKQEIPYLSRLVAILDSYDAMTSDRAYRTKMTNEEACKEIKKCSGTQFDPDLVEIFLEEFSK